MWKPYRLAVILLVAAGMSLILTASAKGADTPEFGDLVLRLAPSVVLITGYMGQTSDLPYAETSGFFIADDGFVVTVPDVFTDRESAGCASDSSSGCSTVASLKQECSPWMRFSM